MFGMTGDFGDFGDFGVTDFSEFSENVRSSDCAAGLGCCGGEHYGPEVYKETCERGPRV